jgi:DNA-binding phage protein
VLAPDFAEANDMIELAPDPNNVVEHLNKVLRSDDPTIFQKILLDFIHGQHAAAYIAEQVGVRRETIWRYRNGVAAPFGTVAKMVPLIGATLRLVPFAD